MQMRKTEKESLEALARCIDVSCVRAFHTRREIDEMIEAARRYRFIGVFTMPAFSEYAANKLINDRDIHVGGVVSFPGGADTTASKGRQARELREMGCQELDMVMNLSCFKSKEYGYVIEDILAVKENGGGLPVKVIIESPSLTGEEIRRAVELCVTAGADYVKTSTGWYPAPATLEQVKLMASQAQGRIRIKAAGGIRNMEQIRSMQAAGCSRFGMGVGSALELMRGQEMML